MVMDFGMRRAAATERRGTDFEMRTNIKARPGAQGTLFQGGKPTAQHRWARGYSPTRMAQMGGALMLGGGGIHISASPEAGTEHFPDISHPHFNPHSEEHTKRLMLESLARSTYEAGDAGRLIGGIHMVMGQGHKPGEAAHYTPSDQRITVNPQMHRGSPREQIAKADAVLMHEMGHHVDMSHNWARYNDELNREHGGNMEAGFRGKLETNADANMIKHFRNDPRNQRQTGIDARKLTYGGRGHGRAAGIGYVDPGAEQPAAGRARRFEAKRRQHHLATGEVASQSPLHPGQFKNDIQQVLF